MAGLIAICALLSLPSVRIYGHTFPLTINVNDQCG